MQSTESQPVSRDKEKARDGEEVVALSRGLDVLRRIAGANAPVSNRELAEWTGIPKPTVSRLTATLVSANLLFQLPDSERFVLTASVLELSNGFLRNFDIRARARPFLIDLADKTTLSVHLAVRDRLEMVVIDAIRPRSAVLVSRLEVGARMDMGRTAVGRAYLAVLGEHDRRTILQSLQTASGDDWPSVNEGLQPSLDDALRVGFAISTGEWHKGCGGRGLCRPVRAALRGELRRRRVSGPARGIAGQSRASVARVRCKNYTRDRWDVEYVAEGINRTPVARSESI
jgi:IclR family transcriptional regulator, positive regulator for flagellar biogenesis